jgi:hypothetical protein
MGFNFHDNQLMPTEFNSKGDLHAAASLIKSGVELKVMVNTSMQKFYWKKDDVFAHFKGKGGVPEYLVNRWEEYCANDAQRILWDIAVFEAVLRVSPGGDEYRVTIVDDTSESHNVIKVCGPYRSR